MNRTAALPSQTVGVSPLAIFWAFLKLGSISFGGPIAHLGYFRKEFVERRRWLDDPAYADLVALCQLLPGPASSQVGIALGASQAGVPGALAAWLGFTLPSAMIMIACGYGPRMLNGTADAGWLHGLKIAAVAVVTQAVWSMGQRLCPDRSRAGFAVLAAVLVSLWSIALAQLAAIATGALAGWYLLTPAPQAEGGGHFESHIGRRTAWSALALFFGLLILLPLAAASSGSHSLDIVDRFYRAGSLVFGGGHVMLPLLRAQTVPSGWLSDSTFLAGYGVAQALPGPLSTFAAYIGTASRGDPSGWLGGLLALAAIFAPAFLLVLGVLPHWNNLRSRRGVRAALDGVNAVTVGILLAALYDPIFVSAVRTPADFALALAAFTLLVWWKAPPLPVVMFAAFGASVLAQF